MTKTRLLTVLVALVALALPATASAATDPLDPAQWHMVAPKSGQKFNMWNEINREAIGYGDRRFGVDLEWKKSGDWIFYRKPIGNVRDHRGYLRPDEKVALYHTGARRYLIHKGQKFGINLDWSSSPSYEWRVEHQVSKFRSALYNVSAGDYVVYGKRTWGINLQWLADLRESQPDPVGTVRDASVTLTAQPPVSGYVPFAGHYGGGGTKAVLTRVTVPSNGPRVFFVKRGRSSSECGNPDAVFALGAGQSLTGEQMKALWLSAEPSLATPVPFLVCAATQASTVWLNLKYRTTG